MKLPEMILIKGDIWQIRLVKEIEAGKNTVGLCDEQDNMIYIKRGQSTKDKVKTFIHELLHAIEISHNFNIPHRLVYALEEPIYQLIKDNFYG